MRKAGKTLKEIIMEVSSLQGKNIDMEVNLGRKKIEKYNGIIDKIYPSVFTVIIKNPSNIGMQSYSFNDVLCGDVKIVDSK